MRRFARQELGKHAGTLGRVRKNWARKINRQEKMTSATWVSQNILKKGTGKPKLKTLKHD